MMEGPQSTGRHDDRHGLGSILISSREMKCKTSSRRRQSILLCMRHTRMVFLLVLRGIVALEVQRDRVLRGMSYNISPAA